MLRRGICFATPHVKEKLARPDPIGGSSMHKISWPNRITIIRILLVGPFVVMLLHLQEPQWGERARWSALAIFAVMTLSDGLDGYLARRLQEQSAAGRFLDPLADKLVILCSVILLAREGTQVKGALLPPTVAVIAVGKDLIVLLGFCIIYFTTSRAYIDPRGLGKWCTLMQLSMVISVLLSPNLPGILVWLPAVLWWSASLLAIATVVHYFQLGRSFIAEHELEGEAVATGDDEPGPPRGTSAVSCSPDEHLPARGA